MKAKNKKKRKDEKYMYKRTTRTKIETFRDKNSKG